MRSPSGSSPAGAQRRAGDDRGSATAELAVALPAVVVVLAVCVWGIQLAAVQVRLQDVAGLAARAAARGDDPSAAGAAYPGSIVSIRERGDLVCASASAVVPSPVGLPPVTVDAVACSLLQQW